MPRFHEKYLPESIRPDLRQWRRHGVAGRSGSNLALDQVSSIFSTIVRPPASPRELVACHLPRYLHGRHNEASQLSAQARAGFPDRPAVSATFVSPVICSIIRFVLHDRSIILPSCRIRIWSYYASTCYRRAGLVAHDPTPDQDAIEQALQQGSPGARPGPECACRLQPGVSVSGIDNASTRQRVQSSPRTGSGCRASATPDRTGTIPAQRGNHEHNRIRDSRKRPRCC
jgi:hypothetical protein